MIIYPDTHKSIMARMGLSNKKTVAQDHSCSDSGLWSAKIPKTSSVLIKQNGQESTLRQYTQIIK